jgi:hypothetical protein
MGVFASAIGGKQFLAWVVAYIACFLGRIPMDVFQTFTMAFMLTQAVEAGIIRQPGDQPSLLSRVLAGRKFIAWAAVSVLLLFRTYDPTDWLEVSAAYVGGEMLETITYAATNRLQKLTLSKTRETR